MLTNEEKVLKVMCENDLLFFTRYIYKSIHNRKFKVAPHFVKMADTLMKVINGEITRLVINIPPRYGKTELAVKNFIAYGLAINPSSKFIHLSYSDTLALDNSSQAKEYIEHEAFQRFWRMNLKKDAQGKQKWFNEFGGGVYATASGGAITGFGAGVTDSDKFAGAIIIDDPLKPDDAFSEVKRKAVNDRFNNTIRSRVNDRNTPIIVIMQRLHEDDMSGFLLDGGSGEEWHHLCLSAVTEDNKALWEDKHTLDELMQIKNANAYTFAGQYMQTPAPDEGGEWKKDWFNIVNKNDLPNDIKWCLYIDGAYTKDTANDPTGLLIAGRSGSDLYIYSALDKYMELPELTKFIPTYLSSLPIRVDLTLVEPKASGKSIKQVLQLNARMNISEIKSDMVQMSKIERARTVSPFIEGGRIYLVQDKWNDVYLNQIATFPNAKHDEYIDLTSYAIDRELIKKTGNYTIR